jgi:hypothetical protein
MSKHLQIFYGKAGSGKTYQCHKFLKENPDYTFLPHDNFKSLNDQIDLLQRSFTFYMFETTNKSVILKELMKNYDIAVVYAQFFISLYTAVVCRRIRDYTPDNFLLEIPYIDRSIDTMINFAESLGYKVSLVYVDEKEDVIKERLQARGWTEDRIKLTNYLWDYFYTRTDFV